MIDPVEFLHCLEKEGYSYFTGVPDSLLKELCAVVAGQLPASRHVSAANEGAAVGLAAGHYLGTGNPAVVYMQNSGTGNAVNPLLSLADPEVYSIPMLLIIGWRGEPGVKDEPQHIKQGRVQTALIEAMEYHYQVLSENMADVRIQVSELSHYSRQHKCPVVLLVRKGSFESYASAAQPAAPALPMTREEALGVVLKGLHEQDLVVSTTGKTSREIYEWRDAMGQDHSRDFLTVGSMGHASMIALGLAQQLPTNRKVVCIDGDGASIMHMGSMAVLAQQSPENLVHVVINNGAHESVGGQPTVGFDVSLPQVADAVGYRKTVSVSTESALRSFLTDGLNATGPVFVEIRTRTGSRSDLGRPKTSPQENKTAFMQNLNKQESV